MAGQIASTRAARSGPSVISAQARSSSEMRLQQAWQRAVVVRLAAAADGRRRNRGQRDCCLSGHDFSSRAGIPSSNRWMKWQPVSRCGPGHRSGRHSQAGRRLLSSGRCFLQRSSRASRSRMPGAAGDAQRRRVSQAGCIDAESLGTGSGSRVRTRPGTSRRSNPAFGLRCRCAARKSSGTPWSWSNTTAARLAHVCRAFKG